MEQCDFSGREIPDWKPVLALADAARSVLREEFVFVRGEVRSLARRLGRATHRCLRD